jgi:hypothetical protein
MTTLRQTESLFLPLILILLSGCGQAESASAAKVAPASSTRHEEFDPQNIGHITGQVTWDGAIPSQEIFETIPNPQAGELLQKKQYRPNPNLPRVDSSTRGVGNAVIYLRGIAPSKCKPWDQPPVRVEQQGAEFHILQGNTDSNFGFVHRGDSMAMVSRDRYFHALHADGAAYFSLMFPEPDRPLERKLEKNGIIELTSGAGYFWMRGYLFVDEHPYYTRTDAQGRFSLEQVPPGRYDLVCWLPSWKKASHDRDPESGNIFRLRFQKPMEVSYSIEVKTNKVSSVQLQFRQ